MAAAAQEEEKRKPGKGRMEQQKWQIGKAHQKPATSVQAARGAVLTGTWGDEG